VIRRGLVHHVSTGVDNVWTETVATGHPGISDLMEDTLRPVVMGRSLRHDAATETTKWYHCEGWAAVLDLHRKGLHTPGMQLAMLLHWCDQQANGRSTGFWEITHEDDGT
jgi:hypothetical protein